MDALLGRRHGLPAMTGLLGKQWNTAWDRDVIDRRVVVIYDVGAEDEAARTVERLWDAGAASAWFAPLGLPEHGDDLSDWFLKYGRTFKDLLRVIRRAGRSA